MKSLFDAGRIAEWAAHIWRTTSRHFIARRTPTFHDHAGEVLILQGFAGCGETSFSVKKLRHIYDKHIDEKYTLYNVIAYMRVFPLKIPDFLLKMLHKNMGLYRVAHIWRTRPLEMVVSAW